MEPGQRLSLVYSKYKLFGRPKSVRSVDVKRIGLRATQQRGRGYLSLVLEVQATKRHFAA
jgi:hypothetical protein